MPHADHSSPTSHVGAPGAFPTRSKSHHFACGRGTAHGRAGHAPGTRRLTRRRKGPPPLVKKVEGRRKEPPRQRRSHDRVPHRLQRRVVPDHTAEELREKSKAARAVVAQMKAAGVFVFTGGLDDAAPVFSVDASSGTPLFTDRPYSSPRSTSAASPSWMWPTMRRRGCGPERSRWPAVGRKRCDASRSPWSFRRILKGVGGVPAANLYLSVLVAKPRPLMGRRVRSAYRRHAAEKCGQSRTTDCARTRA
jgi:hypothetical protein